MALEGDELLMALTVARLIWLRCNDLVFGCGFSLPSNLFQAATRMVGEFSHVVQTGTVGNPTLSAWVAVNLGCGLGLTHVHLEGDSLIVIDALKKEGPCWSSFGHLIGDTQTCLQRMQCFSVSHVRREANNVAHVLAKLSLSQSINKVWREDCPILIQNALLAEKGNF